MSNVVAVAPRLPILVLAGTDVSPSVLDSVRKNGRTFLSKSRMSAETLVGAVLREAMGIGEADGASDGDHAVLNFSPVIHSKPVRVLLIEDDDGDVAAMRFLLAWVRGAQIQVLHAPTLASALDLLGSGSGIDVVLLDLTLPDCQGLTTLQRVRVKDPSTPVVILARPEDRVEAVEALGQGAQDYLVKGQVDSYLLGQTISRRVDSKNPRSGSQGLKGKGYAAS